MIRRAREGDFDALWPFMKRIFSAGDTYAMPPETTFEEAERYWMAPSVSTYVKEANGRLVGTYLLRENQPGLGNHVANASFMVDADCKGRGIGRELVLHCLAEAKAQGFRAMQFNLVISTNHRAIALWESVGFRIIATLPSAFRHQTRGFVAAHIMHQSLEES